MKFNKVMKYLVFVSIFTLTGCNKSNLESNIYNDMDARKMLFFNLENIKRNEENTLSNYINKISYSYSSGSNIVEKTYRSESNIYSNNLESSDITILEKNKTTRNIYKHAIKDDYLYTYINENNQLDLSKSYINTGEIDAYSLVSSMYLKYDFLSNVQKSSIDFVESILLLPDTSFSNLNFLLSSINDDKITYQIFSNQYIYSLSRTYKEKINNINYSLKINLESTLNISDDKLFSYNITYKYDFDKINEEKDGSDNISSSSLEDASLNLVISGNSTYNRKEASEKEFEFINLINNN